MKPSDEQVQRMADEMPEMRCDRHPESEYVFEKWDTVFGRIHQGQFNCLECIKAQHRHAEELHRNKVLAARQSQEELATMERALGLDKEIKR